MQESQENYKLNITETPPEQEQEPEEKEISNAPEAAMPTIEELDNILEESEKVIKIVSLSEEEIDEMMEQRQELVERLANVEFLRESRLQRVEKYNPLADLKPSDYERLVQEGIIDVSYAERLKKLDELMSQFQSLEYPSAQAQAQSERLSQIRNNLREKLESQIRQQQEEIATRRESVKNKILEHYAKRTQELQKRLTEIESNPAVLERLQAIAEKEKREFEAKMEQERQALIKEVERYVQSLSARQANAFERLSELTDNKEIIQELTNAWEEKDARKRQSIFDKVRTRLIKAIIDGEGEQQLKEPKEIVPWKVSSSIRYGDAINFLQSTATEKSLQDAALAGNKQAQKLLEQCKQIIRNNNIIRKLVGPQWISDPKTNEKRMGIFWAAFETRKKNDEQGITAARKQEREKREAEIKRYEQEARALEAKGGIMYKVPVYDEKGNELFWAWTAFRLEKFTEKIGENTRRGRRRINKNLPLEIERWKVVEVAGAPNGMKVGDSDDLTMSTRFPKEAREAAKRYFVMKGEEFVERVQYNEESQE